MKVNKLLLLVLPLSALAIISFMIESWWSGSKGFFLNIATDLIGIVITITYVDWILNKHKEEEWKEVSELVRFRIRQLLESTVYIFSEAPEDMRKRSGYILWSENYDLDMLTANKPIRKAILFLTIFVLGRKAAFVLIDKYVAEKQYLDIPQQAEKFISSLQGSSWKQFYKDIQSIIKETESVIDLFGSRISARPFRYLLECQISAKHVLQLLELYGDVITGVTTSEAIGKKPEFAAELKNSLSKLLAKLYQDLADLSNELNGKKPPVKRKPMEQIKF